MAERLPSAFTPLARAVLESLSEGVLIIDGAGEIAYANRAARAALKSVESDDDNGRAILPKLARIGARIAPLWIGGSKLGEAVYLPPPQGEGRSTLAERERHAIIQTLDATGWKLTESARRLGISRTTLWRRLRTYGLERDSRGRWSNPS
jgi:transcriptional regulator of acetoin/glycerol metabolism